jgi:hypothetical protein
VKLEQREAPIGFYINNDVIKLLFYKNETLKPTFFSYSSTSKNIESGVFFGVGSGFIFHIIVYQEILTNSIQKIGIFQKMLPKMQTEIFYYSKISKMRLVIQYHPKMKNNHFELFLLNFFH